MARMTKAVKNHFVAFLGELCGTFLFLFFAFAGTQLANMPSNHNSGATGPDLTALLYISLIFGFSLAINVWVFFRISGGLFNPAVTLALCLSGVVPVLRSVFIFVAQLLGGIAAAAATKGIIPGNQILFGTSLTPGTSLVQGLFLEMFLTCELVFTILMLAAEKTKATFVAPVGIGLALFVAELVGVYWTGGSLNPARSFGPAVADQSFKSDQWVYWIGPLLGALLATAFYKLMKALKYEEVNGDQDISEHDEKILATAKGHSRRGGSRRSHYDERHDEEMNGYDRHESRAGYPPSPTRGQHPTAEQYRQQPRTSRDSTRRTTGLIPEPPTVQERLAQFSDPQHRGIPPQNISSHQQRSTVRP